MVRSEGFSSLLAGTECGEDNGYIMITEEKRYVIARLRPINGVQDTKVVMHNLEWSIAEVMAAVDLADYRYFWFETIDMLVERDEGRVTCIPHIKMESVKFFINAYVEEYADVCVNNKELAFQMTNLNWTHIVRSIALNKDDNACWTEKFDPLCDKIVDLKGRVND